MSKIIVIIQARRFFFNTEGFEFCSLHEVPKDTAQSHAVLVVNQVEQQGAQPLCRYFSILS